MYQIKCDNYILYDPRDDELVVQKPKCTLEVNKVGSASFTILPTHPFYSMLKKLKSVIEIKQDSQTIFRGRITEDTDDIDNILNVDVEGALAYTNDSIIPPFTFPSVDFPEAETAENVVAYFLGWVLDKHNEQVEPWQRLKLGKVTVSDPNNYINRSSSAYDSTWNILKSKLFNSALGGKMIVRYEDDGNYIDYLDKFEFTNTQRIVFGENMRDISKNSDATSTYSAIFPQGAEGLTIASLPDGDVSEDLVKKGIFIYSRSAVEKYGWICVPIKDSKWSDVTVASNLQTKAMEKLSGDAVMLSSTISFTAADLHYSDEEIQSFKPFRNVLADSPVHGVKGAAYELTKMTIDILNPQNITITIGVTDRTLNDINEKQYSDTIERVESAEKDIANNREETSEVKNQALTQATKAYNDATQFTVEALKDYVETSTYKEYQETVKSEFKQTAESITLGFFNQATERINGVNDDLQTIKSDLEKHFEFSEDGLTIRAGTNTMTLTLDNDIIVFKKNGVEFGKWDGVDFYTGNIIVAVNEKAQFGNFAFVPRTNGSLSFLKVGG